MDSAVEHEICANCKKEIPHFNYVMHTAHCARKISLCQVCKEPVPKNEMEQHLKKHMTKGRTVDERVVFPRQISKNEQLSKETMNPNSQSQNGYGFRQSLSGYRLGGQSSYNSESSRGPSYNHRQKSEESTAQSQYSSSRQRVSDNLCKSQYISGSNSYEQKLKTGAEKKQTEFFSKPTPIVDRPAPLSMPTSTTKPRTSSLLPCKFCDLELPKLDLEAHENYCGARTDKCNECGEIVMYKYKKLHEETNHGFLKLNDEPGPTPTWDSDTQRPVEPSYLHRQRPEPIYTVDSFDFSPLYNSYSNYSSSSLGSESNGEKKETYRDISRRLDCKTEYIRNLLHDSASIRVPLRRNGITPRNHFNHNKGPAPQPPHRRPNPPTELIIPCEFCHTPIPHEELIQHETGCRPDLARFNPRRRSPSPDDYFVAPAPSTPEVELPCEFCADMFPASELLRHQLTCA